MDEDEAVRKAYQCYVAEDGSSIYPEVDAVDPPKTLTCKGKKYHLPVWDNETHAVFNCDRGYPRISTAMGVHPSQRSEVNEYCRKNNVPTEHTASGDPILTSRKHEKEYMRARGFCHWNAGYGDAAPSF